MSEVINGQQKNYYSLSINFRHLPACYFENQKLLVLALIHLQNYVPFRRN